jgi:5-methylcytosine-specific restriction endonuclease McrA
LKIGDEAKLICFSSFNDLLVNEEDVRRFSIFWRDGFTCVYCLHSAFRDGVKLNIDHFIPQSRGGSDEWSNLVTACEFCNAKKGVHYSLIE